MKTCYQTAIISLLCVNLCVVPDLMAQAASGGARGQKAGRISAQLPSGTRNGVKTAANQVLQWEDLLRTDASGRMRVALDDGSLLSLGSKAELRVVKHDATSQQTVLQLNYGRVRSRVVALARPGSMFEVRTPNAVAGVIGTDFEVSFFDGKTTVTSFEGTVSVSSNTAPGTVTVGPGQTVTVGSGGVGAPVTSAPDAQVLSVQNTGIHGSLGGTTGAAGGAAGASGGTGVAVVAGAAAATAAGAGSALAVTVDDKREVSPTRPR